MGARIEVVLEGGKVKRSFFLTQRAPLEDHAGTRERVKLFVEAWGCARAGIGDLIFGTGPGLRP